MSAEIVVRRPTPEQATPINVSVACKLQQATSVRIKIEGRDCCFTTKSSAVVDWENWVQAKNFYG